MTGFLLIDKPESWTSHDVVGYLRRVTGMKKIGHAGTLDPFATGLLIVGIGREATKRIDEFKAMPKTYTATIRLGATSDTEDSTGHITLSIPKQTNNIAMQQYNNIEAPLSESEIKQVLKSFIGKQTQIPPMYSAKKVGGKKLYELARKGIEIERQLHDIEIHDIKLLNYQYPNVDIAVDCGTGTYIRTLAADIGEALGTGAYCDKLRRTKIGVYDVENAKEPKTLTSAAIEKNLFLPED
jgi:tRNA pseudouridine55 synthase